MPSCTPTSAAAWVRLVRYPRLSVTGAPDVVEDPPAEVVVVELAEFELQEAVATARPTMAKSVTSRRAVGRRTDSWWTTWDCMELLLVGFCWTKSAVWIGTRAVAQLPTSGSPYP